MPTTAPDQAYSHWDLFKAMPLLQRRIHFWAAGLVGSGLLRLYRRTWRIRIIDPRGVGELVRKGQQRVIAAFWHRALLALMCACRGMPFCVPVSEHRDGEYLSHVMERWGFLAVRGSTTRGSVRLLRDLLGAIAQGWCCAVTPDGPRGPRFSVQPGFAMLARRSGLPVHPLGVAVENAWVLNSWDAFLLPKPGTRIAIVVGDPMPAEVLASGSTGGVCAALKEAIDQATDQAEQSLHAT